MTNFNRCTFMSIAGRGSGARYVSSVRPKRERLHRLRSRLEMANGHTKLCMAAQAKVNTQPTLNIAR